MEISVIIAHDPKRLDVDLAGLKAEVHQQMEELELKGEILIATDGSKSSARNKAVHESTGEILVFLDDDVQLRRHFLLEILDPFIAEDVGIVGGVNIAFPDVSQWERISACMMSSPLYWGKSTARYTSRGDIRKTDESELVLCCMAVRRKAFLDAGGFPLDVIPCEENVLINRIQKLGWLAIYNPFAVVFHRRAEFPRGYARKIFEYGMGRGIMIKRGGGLPKAIWKPKFEWFYYFVGLFVHYGAYLMGVLYGFLKTKKDPGRDE